MSTTRTLADSDDLRWCIETCLADEMSPDDVAEIALEITGENDGPDWHWIVRLTDGRWAYIHGGCDYTGWHCRSGAYARLENTMDDAIDQVGEIFGPVFRDMLATGDMVRNSTMLSGDRCPCDECDGCTCGRMACHAREYPCDCAPQKRAPADR